MIMTEDLFGFDLLLGVETIKAFSGMSISKSGKAQFSGESVSA